MSGNVALQREILAAIQADDRDALEAIAVREGIDVDLWRFSQDVFQRASELDAEFLARSLTKSVQTLSEQKD